MLLRYSHHQIFVFIGEFGQGMLSGSGTVYRLQTVSFSRKNGNDISKKLAGKGPFTMFFEPVPFCGVG